MELRSDLYLYDILYHIRKMAHESLIDDTVEWRIKREEALREIVSTIDKYMKEEKSE